MIIVFLQYGLLGKIVVYRKFTVIQVSKALFPESVQVIKVLPLEACFQLLSPYEVYHPYYHPFVGQKHSFQP